MTLYNNEIKNLAIVHPTVYASVCTSDTFHNTVYAASPDVLDAPEIDEEITTKLTNRVILFNDEWHTFEEVIEQIMKATGCSTDKAEILTWEVHSTGKAMVYEGDMGECLRVSNILEEIALRTQIEC